MFIMKLIILGITYLNEVIDYMSHERLWSASVEEIQRGYVYNEEFETYECLICNKKKEVGVIYPIGDGLYEAKKAIQLHIEEEHQSMFHYLINMNKKYTGLTDTQREMLSYFQQGLSDKEIASKVGGSASTIRNHRFKFKEKEKQAKIFLAISGLLKDSKEVEQETFLPIHRGATMIDDRYAITEDEKEKVLQTYFKDGLNGKLNQFPSKEKRKIIILQHILKRFEIGKQYSEREVNDILKSIFDDFATIRRYLIEYGFMDRSKDCQYYWVKE